MAQRKPIVAGNWKMNGSVELVSEISTAINECKNEQVDIIIFPPAPLLLKVVESGISVGTQTVSEFNSGAFTGELSAELAKQLGATHTLVGHSERRIIFGESNESVADKFAKAQENGLIPILCVGETEQQRDAEETEMVVAEQINAVISKLGIAALLNSVLAYEPVWAIGTGKTATPEQAQAVHKFIRDMLSKQSEHVGDTLQILYGGSVNDKNSKSLFIQPDIDGGLIGGASLKADAFVSICNSALGNV
ncbi:MULTISPECIES: triose-phosphate isomerase [unclassified Pseudoalteromonas]|uniref:triose-phosphate isomerase n=1 Tax=unclassified Pseudoalteromonas TaxID=194690 RepID=UPI001B3A0673|nr:MULTISPECIES: triose-phosphate isomerase [unclassified Pseudoalteromonas]MBQ4845838.1 triose-phosphate isomerase [Pseudoalteromonas sp. MMG005]MBQ4849092.1 triose-phosphate isomerase [Pseudoalteromonas sp. MMG012]